MVCLCRSNKKNRMENRIGCAWPQMTDVQADDDVENHPVSMSNTITGPC